MGIRTFFTGLVDAIERKRGVWDAEVRAAERAFHDEITTQIESLRADVEALKAKADPQPAVGENTGSAASTSAPSVAASAGAGSSFPG